MKFLLATWGSSGDLHPFIALGREMRARGHEVTLAGNPLWSGIAEKEGMAFLPAGPVQSSDIIFAHPEVISDEKFGFKALRALMNIGVAPVIDDSYRTLCAAAPHHDALVAHFLLLTAGAVAEKTGIDWVTVTLAPGVIPSRHTMPAGSFLQPFRGVVGEGANHLIWQLGRRMSRKVVDPHINRLREREGLPSLVEAVFSNTSPQLNLQLYSPEFASMPPDWTVEKKQAGFCYLESTDDFMPPPQLEKFLAAGDKPWLFTLGTAIVAQPGAFYATAVEAMKGIPERAILLTGLPQNQLPDLPPNVMTVDYLPYDWIMPRCSVVAHQCGIGTLSHVLRAGLPSVACPYAFDQPNNSMRLQALGVAVFLPAKQRTAAALRVAMREAVKDPIATRARELGERLRRENGPRKACEILEATFQKEAPVGVTA
jgi:rhamnosyltransferase subunit B